MDNRRHPDHTTGPADPPAYDTPAYWVDGVAGAADTDSPEPDRNATGAEPETTEPLALAPARSGARPRHQAPGPDDDTPPAGTPMIEPPLWREATRFVPSARGYGSPTEYVSTFATQGDEPDGYPARADGGEPYPGRHDGEPYAGRRDGELYPGRYDGERYPGRLDEGVRLDPDPSESVDDAPGRPRSGPPDPVGAPSAPPVPAPPTDHRPTSGSPISGSPVSGDPSGVGPADPGPFRPGPLDPEPAVTGRPASGPPAPELASLPQRIPAEPDVPVASSAPPDSGGADDGQGDRWTAPELAWIADQLRRDDVPGDAPSEPLDVDAVLTAVREVSGVRAASVRTGPGGTPTLRLDLADEADPGEVSRSVARLLLERMGLSAAPSEPDGSTGWAPPAPRLPMDAPLPALEPTTLASGAPSSAAPTSGVAGPASGPPAPKAGAAPPPPPGLSPEVRSVRLPVVETPPEPVSRPLPTSQPGPRVVIDQVLVRSQGLEAQVEVRLTAARRRATGRARGPAMDSYLVRLAAVATAGAIDELLRDVEETSADAEPSRCFVEHTGVVAFGETEVAVAVVLLVCGGWVERLTGSALVDGDPRHAVVRATLGAVNRRLEALLD